MVLSDQIFYRQHCPMLLAQIQQAVTRVDEVKSFTFRDFLEVHTKTSSSHFLLVLSKSLLV